MWHLTLRMTSKPWSDSASSKLVSPHIDCKVRILLSDLKVCTKSRDLDEGRKIHQNVTDSRLDANLYVANTLINMYVKCGCMDGAHKVFDSLQRRTVVSWTSLILGYVDCRQEYVALELFALMVHEGCVPDDRTFLAALKACSGLAAKEEGVLVEGKLVKNRSLQRGMAIHLLIHDGKSNIHLASTLVGMYAKCGDMVEARAVFETMRCRTVVSWNALMFGYAESMDCLLALELFSRMKCVPDDRTYVAALKSCSNLAKDQEERCMALENGLAIHSLVYKGNNQLQLCVANALIDMYAKCGCLVDARKVFDSIRRDVVSWNTLILGYVENGYGETALKLFCSMVDEGLCNPDVLTFVFALKACGTIGALDVGKALHEDCIALGFANEEILLTTLVDFYGKCGRVLDAQLVFDALEMKSLVAWTALIAAYSRVGDIERVFELLYNMRDTGIQPNRVTFLCILAACSHTGLVEQGKKHFKTMSSMLETAPGTDHYACMVDMFHRAGLFP